VAIQDDADDSGETPEVAIAAEAEEALDATEDDDGVARKRRGIRLKQDLS
jgi:hypothetical protein